MAGRLRIRQAILAILSLLFAWFQTAYAHVEPPTNVTFRCHNLEDLLQWSYEPWVEGLRFRVNILSLQSPAAVLWVDPPALQANLSLLTNPVDDNFVSVTAVVGKNESEEAPADGIQFSYVRESLVTHKCSVDFPPVDVRVDANGHILFSFEHPWLSYGSGLPRAKSRQKKSDEKKMPMHTPDFSYTVQVNQYLEEKFVCNTNMCKEKLPVEPKRERQCLKVEGEIQMMYVRGSQEYCDSLLRLQHMESKNFNITTGVVTAVAVIVLAVVAYIVYKKKTNPSPLSPNSVMFNGQRRPGTLNLPQDQFRVPEVEPRENDESEEDVTPTVPSTEPDLRFRLGVENELAEVRCDEGSEYMPGSELEVALLNGSGYEQRPVVRVELAPGEEAEGYRLGGL